MLKDYSEFWISSGVAIEHTAALFYSWSIRYTVNRAPVTLQYTSAYSIHQSAVCWFSSNKMGDTKKS